MTDEHETVETDDVADDRVDRRAELLPEEATAGSADSHEQAEVILEDSDFRTEHPEAAREQSHQLPPGG